MSRRKLRSVEVSGLLGRNGASKTSVIKLLAGLSLAVAVLNPLADWAFRRRFKDFTW